MPEKGFEHLPRAWMMAGLEIAAAATLKGYVKDAVLWGFDEPADLSNNAKRIRWLSECRERAWDMVVNGQSVPTPGVSQPTEPKPTKATKKPRARKKPSRPKAPDRPMPAPVQIEADDIYPPKARRFSKPKTRRTIVADQCEITAADCNEFLRSLPYPPPYTGAK